MFIFLVVTAVPWGGRGLLASSAEVTDAAEHLTMHRMVTTAKNDLAPTSVVPRMRKPHPRAENCLSAKVRDCCKGRRRVRKGKEGMSSRRNTMIESWKRETEIGTGRPSEGDTGGGWVERGKQNF